MLNTSICAEQFEQLKIGKLIESQSKDMDFGGFNAETVQYLSRQYLSNWFSLCR